MNATVGDIDVGVVPNTAGCTAEEQQMLADLCARGFIDVFRSLKPSIPGFTWHPNNKTKNGMRLDYFFISPQLLDIISDINIINEINTCDHLPLLLSLKSN